MPDARDLLEADGPIADALAGRYEPRAEQLDMADAVQRTMENRTHLLAEAGTGVGKSFAYLVPAMVRAICFGERVVVSTHTIALQEQLIARDIPLLERVLQPVLLAQPGNRSELHASLVKGRGNYLSIRRLELASKRRLKLFGDEPSRRSLGAIEQWAYATQDGTLSTLPPLEKPGVWDRVQSDSGNCMGRKCPRYTQCFYQNARRDMERANLLVTNHALFFSDLALRSRGTGFLPRYDHVVLDEAHTVEDVAADHFGLSLTEGRVMHLLGVLLNSRTNKGYLSNLELPDDRPVLAAADAVNEAELAAREFFGSLGVVAGDNATLRVHEPEIVANTVTPAFDALAGRLKRLKEALPDEPQFEPDKFELNSYTQRAAEIARACDALINQSQAGYVYWIDASRSSTGRPRVSIASSPIDVGPILSEELFGKDFSVCLTSATLATSSQDEGKGFEHAMQRLGATGADTIRLGSPFDYENQVRLIVDQRVGTPGRGLDRGYEERLAAAIVEHVGATRGGAFVLFTSHRTLRAMARACRDPLGRMGINVHAQDADGSRALILERFREDPNSALFGAASFWQGVDVPGDTLRNVIITRLPFDPPDRPLAEARAERLKEQGKDPFREDSLPRAVIRFKQGFGRLVRSASDSGRVVVLDPRLATARYGSLFIKAMPPGVPVEQYEGEPLGEAAW
ncbi:MAG: helicase C-terminal domain-containing protein [Phycisphaerales bacterium]